MSLPTVARVEWITTRRCNNNCSYCAIRKPSKRLGPELSTSEAIRVIDILHTYWPGAPVNLFGGEPTERKDLPVLIKAMAENDQMAILSSNSIKAHALPGYIKMLAGVGLKNWTVSFDGLSRSHCVDEGSWKRALIGMEVLQLAREAGITDLVANITITRHNIEFLPQMLTSLTSNGIWSIFCMLQLGHPGYEYSKGRKEDLPTRDQMFEVFSSLGKMIRSKRYLVQTSAEWFDFLLEFGVEDQTWTCDDKASLTIDSDGSLKHCVDVPLKKRLTIFDLDTEQGRELYSELIQKPKCKGCLWDSAYDSINRCRNVLGEDEARRFYRHELTKEEISKLIPEAQKFF